MTPEPLRVARAAFPEPPIRAGANRYCVGAQPFGGDYPPKFVHEFGRRQNRKLRRELDDMRPCTKRAESCNALLGRHD